MSDRVLVTGISGFVGGHVALALLRAGYRVRGSLRDPARAKEVRENLARRGADVARLDFVALELRSDDGWREAMAGVRVLQHTASPLPMVLPRERAALVAPALQGTRRAVGAALAAGVERVVLTSSMAAIAYGHPLARTEFGASDWTDLSGRPVNAYVESKTRAERAAWELMEAAGRAADLVAINPGVILGPLLGADPGTSALLVKRLLDGGLPALARIALTLIDVRDVAEAHVNAMASHDAGGQRFPMGERTLFLAEIAGELRARFPALSRRIPRHVLPDWAVRLAARAVPGLGELTGELGVVKRFDASAARAARTLLGRPPTPAPDAVAATAASLLEAGLLRK